MTMYRRSLTALLLVTAVLLQHCNCDRGCRPRKTEIRHSVKRPATAYLNSTANEFRIRMVFTERFKRIENYAMVAREYIEPGFEFWKKVMKPKVPTVGTLRLTRKCLHSWFYWIKENGVDQKYCEDACLSQATCQGYAVPRRYMEDCRYKKGSTEEIIRDGGVGAKNTDFLVFIDFTLEGCGDSTVAFAGSCQQNAETDRPEIAYINYCPDQVKFTPKNKALLNGTTIHELGHALGFVSSLYAYMRDDSGNARTQRKGKGNTPALGRIDDILLPDTNTLDTRKKLWISASGSQHKTVYQLTTETLAAAARKHFQCNSLTGVDLENNEGDTAIGSHWKKSLFMDEVMMATTGKGYVSEFTLGFMKDTGWYHVDMSAAERLSWGENKGCEFAKWNCAAYMKLQYQNGRSLAPYCMEVHQYCQSDGTYCSLKKMTDVLPSDLTYFKRIKDVPLNETNRYAGTDMYMDYCPYTRNC